MAVATGREEKQRAAWPGCTPFWHVVPWASLGFSGRGAGAAVLELLLHVNWESLVVS